MKPSLLPLLSLALLAPLGAAAQSTDFEGVVLYEHADYGGSSFVIYPGEGIPHLSAYWESASKTWNDRASSVAVWGELLVYLYEDANYQGDYIVLDAHTPFLGNFWNDRVSSVWVEYAVPTGWYEDTVLSWVYRDADWLYHNNGLGWIYGGYWDASLGQGWLWDLDLGWLYTSASLYPWLGTADGTWYYFAEGTTAPRWFYHQDTGWFALD